jgi:hypothetical protein
VSNKNPKSQKSLDLCSPFTGGCAIEWLPRVPVTTSIHG